MGSVTTLTDATGAVVGRVRYSAFGVPQSSGVTENTVSFTGHQFNTATGLFFARARYYDPTLGRFLSQDPEWAVNPYVYALNAPLTFTDPTGRAASIEDEINRIKGQLANLRASNKRGIFNDLIKQLEKRLEELAKIERDQWHGVPGSR